MNRQLGSVAFKRLSSNILPQALGELELAILQVLWHTPNLSAKAITEQLTQHRDLTLSTIQSSLEGLRNKELVEYKKQRRPYSVALSMSHRIFTTTHWTKWKN